MSSGNVLAALTLQGGRRASAAIGRRQSTMNDVHAVAIQSHYAAVIHQQEHEQHLEAVKQAHGIAGDRGFSVTTNNRRFVVGKSPGSPKDSTEPENKTENPSENPSAGDGGSGSSEPPKPATEAREVKTTPLAIESKPSLTFENIVRTANPAGQHSAANPRQFVVTPEGTTRRVDRTDSSFGENLSANEDRYLAERGAKLRNDSKGGVAGRGGSNLNTPFSGKGSPATRNGVAGRKGAPPIIESLDQSPEQTRRNVDRRWDYEKKRRDAERGN
jgi:hypothetical protein